LYHEKVKQQDRRHIRQRRDRRRSRQSLRRIDISFNATGLSQIGIQGIPLAQLSEEAFLMPINSYLKTHFITAKAAHGITFEQFHEVMTGATHRKRLTTLNELSAAAVFAASDEGSAITGTTFPHSTYNS
jgi:hypothetical protein